MSPPSSSSGPTMRSLAQEAGVSAMTISLALRNSANVSPAMRRRIQALAKARGYQPDPNFNRLMQHLRTRRQQRQKATIACLAPRTPVLPGWRYYLNAIYGGIQARAEALGFAVDRVTPDEGESSTQLQRLLTNRGITGLILMPMPLAGTLPFRLEWDQFSVVSATSSIEAPRFHAVVPNHFDNLLGAFHRLRELGYKRIGLAIPSDVDRRVNFRWSAALAWHRQQEAGGFLPPLVTEGPIAPDVLRAWVARHQPDVVILHPVTDEVETLRALPKATRPKIVTFAPSVGSLAFLDQNPATVGEVAVSILAGLMATNTTGIPRQPHFTLVDGVWRSGKDAAAKIALGSARKF